MFSILLRLPIDQNRFFSLSRMTFVRGVIVLNDCQRSEFVDVPSASGVLVVEKCPAEGMGPVGMESELLQITKLCDHRLNSNVYMLCTKLCITN